MSEPSKLGISIRNKERKKARNTLNLTMPIWLATMWQAYKKKGGGALKNRMAADRHRIFGLCHLSLERTRQGLETCFSYQKIKKELLESITRNEAKRETAAQYIYSWVHFEIVELVASKKSPPLIHRFIDCARMAKETSPCSPFNYTSAQTYVSTILSILSSPVYVFFFLFLS